MRIITFPPTLINHFRKTKTSYVRVKPTKTQTIEFFYVNFNPRGNKWNKWVYSLQIRASTYMHAYRHALMHTDMSSCTTSLVHKFNYSLLCISALKYRASPANYKPHVGLFFNINRPVGNVNWFEIFQF